MVLYLDVFFLVNMIFDACLLLAVRMVLRRRAGGRRIAVAAAAGGAWACAAVIWEYAAGCSAAGYSAAGYSAEMAAGAIFDPGTAVRLLTGLLGSAGMAALAFRPKGIGELFRCAAALWMFGQVAAGGCELVGMERSWTLAAVSCTFIGICFLSAAAAGYLKQARAVREKRYQVTIRCRGKETAVTALWDTGNQLYEPYGHRPVHVITRKAAGELGVDLAPGENSVSGEERMSGGNRVQGEKRVSGEKRMPGVERVSGVERMLDENSVPGADPVMFVYIPYTAVGTERGMLPGIRAERMEIRKDGVLVKTEEKPWLAVSNEALTGTRGYEMLLHGETFAGEYDN